jgi:hypothetical protein
MVADTVALVAKSLDVRGTPGTTRSMGWVRLRACTWVFSSTQRTIVRLWWVYIDPSNVSDLSGELSDHWICVKVSTMWGFKPKVRHILPTVEGETPAAAAMVLVGRWVEASGGVVVVSEFDDLGDLVIPMGPRDP